METTPNAKELRAAVVSGFVLTIEAGGMTHLAWRIGAGAGPAGAWSSLCGAGEVPFYAVTGSAASEISCALCRQLVVEGNFPPLEAVPWWRVLDLWEVTVSVVGVTSGLLQRQGQPREGSRRWGR